MVDKPAIAARRPARPAPRRDRQVVYDLAIIGGGINGCGIARDAAGRGLSVFLCEQSDLGSGTSSASSKLIHGGLRYLEQRQFKLVRESLRERATLQKTAPHLISPLRFVLPHHPGLRPRWLIRAGLWVYDLLGWPGAGAARSRQIKLGWHHQNAALKGEFTAGFEYTDCHADDARLTIAIAKDARRLGAIIWTRARCQSATRGRGMWEIAVQRSGQSSAEAIYATAMVNAAGPWVGQFLSANPALQSPAARRVKLVKGSHIVVKKWYRGGHAYLLQNPDRRVVFVIPFQRRWAIIGTTEVECEAASDPGQATISAAEADYLRAAAARYFHFTLQPEDVVWSYSGVRPLYDDGAESLREVTRGYAIERDAERAMLTIYGGKLTTFRRLAEAAVNKLAPFFPAIKPPWSADAVLPGADMKPADSADAATLARAYPFLPRSLVARYLAAYGSESAAMLGATASMDGAGAEAADHGMGQHFGHGLYQIEVDYLVDREWARSAEDILWRRSKLGLLFTADETAALERWLQARFKSI